MDAHWKKTLKSLKQLEEGKMDSSQNFSGAAFASSTSVFLIFICRCLAQSCAPSPKQLWCLGCLGSFIAFRHLRKSHIYLAHPYVTPCVCETPYACSWWVKINLPLYLHLKPLKSLMNLSSHKRLFHGLSQSLRKSGLQHRWDECLLKVSGNWEFWIDLFFK